MLTESLPPAPDPQTGEPRPPRAPVSEQAIKRKAQPEEIARPLDAPSGQGPTLETYVTRWRDNITTALLALLLMVGLYTLWDWGLGWIDTWYLWAVAAGGSALFLAVRPMRVAAGARWFSSEGHWVDTYALVQIKGSGAWLSTDFQFTDAAGRTVMPDTRKLQTNRDLWDLVYHGILHSMHTRNVEINGIAWRELYLDDYAPAMNPDAASSTAPGAETDSSGPGSAGPADTVTVGATTLPKRLLPIGALILLPVLVLVLVLAVGGGFYLHSFLGGLEHGALISWGISVTATLAALVYGIRHRNTGRSR